MQGIRINIEGAVQGVGFRPFVYRLAGELGLTGYVSNTTNGVLIELNGSGAALEYFLERLTREKPSLAIIDRISTEAISANGSTIFEIQHSQNNGSPTALVLPDVATCPDCLNDIFDPNNRRYRYPFTNCTNCGPRYSIIRALPYDRAHTSMGQFDLCPECRAEYEDPHNRRFHAQPNACPSCGPYLELWSENGTAYARHHAALLAAVEAIRQGKIVAFKGIGGFQLLVDARNYHAVHRLRERKHRPHKPFALMFPSLESVREQCDVSPLESDLLASSAAPVVLLRAADVTITEEVAPGNPYLGVMLPYTPLHHLLMAELGFPIVATSGNLAGEPICIDEYEALERLSGIADLFLVHNRPIVRQVDDSVVQVVAGHVQILRRARGYAPLPVHLDHTLPDILGMGAHQKNTIAASVGDRVFVSQHIGDLDTVEATHVFQRTIHDFETLYNWSPAIVAHDLHPDYLSTHHAAALPQPKVAVQHHYAHVLACMAENQISTPVLGVCWDGTGYGTDGTIWGGEWLRVSVEDDSGFERIAHLRSFRLPGGEQAVREPRRSAWGLLYEIYGDDVVGMTYLAPVSEFAKNERYVLATMLKSSLNSPVTSSMGRLFDGVAALIGLRQRVSFEGQAAMMLEFATDGAKSAEVYDFVFDPVIGVVDWEPMLRGILRDLTSRLPVAGIAAKFHNTLVEMILAVARQTGEKNIALTGGCFQNRYLSEQAIERLRQAGFEPYWHRQVPPNDGGIALGQVIAAARKNRKEGLCV